MGRFLFKALLYVALVVLLLRLAAIAGAAMVVWGVLWVIAD